MRSAIARKCSAVCSACRYVLRSWTNRERRSSSSPTENDFTRRAAKERLAERGLVAFRELGATDREILSLIAEGMTDKQISQRVYLSAQTVRNRISRLLGLLGRDNRTQLALMVTAVDPFVLASPGRVLPGEKG